MKEFLFNEQNGLFHYLGIVLNFNLFTINQTPITVSSLLMFFLFLLMFNLLSRFIRRVVMARALRALQVDEGIRFTLGRITHYVIMLVGAVVAFQFIGIDFSGLAVIFGLLSVGIGFGLQNVASNFISGLILLLERPIRIGDRVTVGNTQGDVMAINIRSTTIRTLNNVSIIMPNSEFVSSAVTNWSHGDPKVRMDLPVGVSYNSDLDTVSKALLEVAGENKSLLLQPKPEVHLIEFGDSSWNMQLRVWLPEPTRYERVRNELNCAIVHKFRQYGVEIPFPQRDLHLRSTLPIPISKVANGSVPN